MGDQVVEEMRQAMDVWAATRFLLYDRNGRRIRWSEMVRLKMRNKRYPIVRRHEVRDIVLVTEWMPYALEGNYGRTHFETYLLRPGEWEVLHKAPTEMEAVRLHYMALGVLLFELEADLSEVRGWLEICA